MHPRFTAASSCPPDTSECCQDVESCEDGDLEEIDPKSNGHLLSRVQISGLLRLIGRATGAESAYLILHRPTKSAASNGLSGRSHCVVWHTGNDNRHADRVETADSVDAEWSFEDAESMHRRVWNGSVDLDTCYQIPIHVQNAGLRAYCGLRFSAAAPTPPRDSLSYLREIISGYLQTYCGAPEASRQSEDHSEESRRQTPGNLAPFLDDLEEGLFHVKLRTPVNVALPQGRQCRMIRHEGYLEECNRVFAGYFYVPEADMLSGQDLKFLLTGSDHGIVKAFVRANYRLRGFEYDLPRTDGARLFSINARGVVTDGYLTDIWGSCTEITGDVIVDQRAVEAQEEQRYRIGRDLHDTVGPLLTALRLWSGRLADTSEHQSEETAARAKKIAGLAEEATERLREVYTGLVPRFLEACTLGDALEDLASKVRSYANLDVTLVQDPGTDVPGNATKMHLHRIVQEAVNNTLKHAKARQITIGLRRRQGRLQVEIHDDGVGFDIRNRSAHSLGIDNMKSRAHAIGASFAINSTPNGGTTVRVTLPDEEAENADHHADRQHSHWIPKRQNGSIVSPSIIG